MNYRKLTLYIILSLIFTLLVALSSFSQVGGFSNESIEDIWKKWLKKYPIAEDAIELEFQHSFPTPDQVNRDIFLWGATRIDQLSNGNIVVLNTKANELLIFNEKGNYIKKFGRKGQGPEEFQHPIGLSVTPELIVVSDNSNRNIQFFNVEGDYIRSFKVMKAYIDIAVSKDGFIYAAPLRVTPESLLVDVFDFTGKLLHSFAEAEFGNKQSSWQIPNFISMNLNDNNEVFVAYEHFPLVCKYSKVGILNSKYSIDYEVINKHIEPNYDNLNNNKSGDFWRVAIASIRTGSDGFYILHNWPRVEILEYDNNGKLQNDYYYNLELWDAGFWDFLVFEKEGEKTFYLLMRVPENEILVFRPKEIT